MAMKVTALSQAKTREGMGKFTTACLWALDDIPRPQAATTDRELIAKTIFLILIGHLTGQAGGTGGEGESLDLFAESDIFRGCPEISLTRQCHLSYIIMTFITMSN